MFRSIRDLENSIFSIFTMFNKEKSGYGNFGVLAEKYDKFRRGVPREVINYFYETLKVFRPVVLDIGCGTGISTRELQREDARLFGLDIDEKMIKLAREKNSAAIDYITGPANNMPFDNKQFDAVTAFSAFHWFKDADSMAEIRRVLKREGLFFVVNKNEAGGFKDGFRAVLKRFTEGDLPDAKKSYKPSEILSTNGFGNVCERIFETDELVTIQQAIEYLQTVSLWNLVSQDRQSEALLALENYCRGRAVHGLVERKINVVTVAGTKL